MQGNTTLRNKRFFFSVLGNLKSQIIMSPQILNGIRRKKGLRRSLMALGPGVTYGLRDGSRLAPIVLSDIRLRVDFLLDLKSF